MVRDSCALKCWNHLLGGYTLLGLIPHPETWESFLHQEAQQFGTSILSFSSGITPRNLHIRILAQGKKRALLRERKSNANQIFSHRKLTAVPNPTILKTEVPKCHFQFLDKRLFPTGTSCHLCCALLA